MYYWSYELFMESFQFTYLAVLFPAIPLMMLTFGNRWISLTSLIRKVHAEFEDKQINLFRTLKENYLAQIGILNKRLRYVKLIKFFSGISFPLNNMTIITGIFNNKIGLVLFTTVLISLSFAILNFLFEIYLSSNAMRMHLGDLEKKD